MVRADVGSRPLINTLTKRYITFTKSIQDRNSALCHDDIVFQIQNSESLNFWSFNQGFSAWNLWWKVWSNKILNSPKAMSFNNFKTNITLEPHLILNFNLKHKIALSTFRLSNHALMIEKGRHLKIDKNKRTCIFCENEIKNEEMFWLSVLFIVQTGNL